MLAASLHSVHESERQMLFEHLDRLSKTDLLLLDRGYPCRWLPAVLNQRGIAFCMRVERSGNSGFACVLDEQTVTLRAPDRCDATDYECPAEPQTVRLIRHIATERQSARLDDQSAGQHALSASRVRRSVPPALAY